MEAGIANIFERLFAIWISAFAAFTFIFALLLAVLNIISWGRVVWVYTSITGVTLLLAALCYASNIRR